MWQDDIEGERWGRIHVSRHLVAFNVTIILRANDIWCFRCLPLLSRDSSHLACIALSLKIV
jgi:hypothetical protein